MLAVGVVMGQENKATTPAAEAKHERTPPPASQTPQGAPDLRRAQLRLLRESTLLRLVGGIKDVGEAALRISARNQILMHLDGDRKATEEDKALAAQIASDALTDFDEHGEEIPPFMTAYLLNDLGASIQKHQPKLVERFQALERNRKGENESDRVRALLQMKGGDVPAAQRIRQLLNEGQ